MEICNNNSVTVSKVDTGKSDRHFVFVGYFTHVILTMIMT